jgi:reactive intermediate/imine deaminase
MLPAFVVEERCYEFSFLENCSIYERYAKIHAAHKHFLKILQESTRRALIYYSSGSPMSPIVRIPSALPFPFSRAVQAGGFIFLSGQIPIDEDGTPVHGPIADQTRLVLDRIVTSLAVCGAGLADVVKVTVWLSDLALFGQFNEVYRDYFQAHALPARSTVCAALAVGVDIEIEVTAYRP